MTLFEAATEVCEVFEFLGIPYAIGGSLASMTWGEPRQTNDVDIAVMLERSTYMVLKTALPEAYLLDPKDPTELMESTQPFPSAQILHMDELLKLDLFLLDASEYSRTSLSRAKKLELVPGKEICVCAPEDAVIAKLRWYELGHRVSDRQWNDIVQVLEVQKGKLDEAYLDKWATHFGVAELLGQAREQTW